MTNIKGLGNSITPDLGGLPQKTNVNPQEFRDLLKAKSEEISAGGVGGPGTLKFSNHAMDRIRQRGLSFTKAEMTQLQDALSKAQSKGSKDSLIIMDDKALIVSVKDKTVVTVMGKDQLKENVFTNIDSTIMI